MEPEDACSECGEPLDGSSWDDLCGYCIEDLEAREYEEQRNHERQERMIGIFL